MKKLKDLTISDALALCEKYDSKHECDKCPLNPFPFICQSTCGLTEDELEKEIDI